MGGRCWRDALVPCAGAVYAHGKVIVRVAVLENTGIVVSGHVPVTSHRVVDMVAVHGGLRTDAGTEAELVFRDEACPLVVLSTRTKGVAVDESTDWVSIAISTAVIQLSTGITLANVDLREIANTSDLHVVMSLHKVHASECAVRDDASASARFGAEGDGFALRVADGAVRSRRSPQAEIDRGVQPDGLAIGRWVRASTAGIDTELAILGFLRKIIGAVARVPNLIRIAIGAAPQLDAVPVSLTSSGQIHALSMVVPRETIIASVGELLILVIRCASPDLQFRAV